MVVPSLHVRSSCRDACGSHTHTNTHVSMGKVCLTHGVNHSCELTHKAAGKEPGGTHEGHGAEIQHHNQDSNALVGANHAAAAAFPREK